MSTKTVESILAANTGAHASIPSGPAASAKPVASAENVGRTEDGHLKRRFQGLLTKESLWLAEYDALRWRCKP